MIWLSRFRNEASAILNQEKLIMLLKQERELLKRCRNHVAQLIEIHNGSGTWRPDLFSDLRQLDALRNGSRRTVERTHWNHAAPNAIRWVDDIVASLEALGGTAHLTSIAQECVRRRKEAGRSVPRNFEAVIRDTLHAHSSDAAKFHYEGSNTQDLFKKESSRGRGWWSLRSKPNRD